MAGTEYTLSEIYIKLYDLEIRTQNVGGTKLYKLPFDSHTCSSTLDLFKTPSSSNYQEVWTVGRIDEEITKGSSNLAASN